MKKIILYTDGGARGNPGPAGAGAALFDENGRTIKEASEYLGHRTNNYAEYRAVVMGLEMVAKHFGKAQCAAIEVLVRMDSELIQKQLTGEYQIKEETLFPFFIQIHNLRVSTFPHLSFSHVPRAENKRADALANEAMDRGGR